MAEFKYYWEDFAVGEVRDLGTISPTREEIIAFATQFDPQSKYHDPAARPEAPRWFHVDIRALRKTRLIGIAELRQHPELDDLLILRRGNRLSITPVTAAQWRFITARLLKASA